MDVLIKNMEMPKKGHFLFQISANGDVWVSNRNDEGTGIIIATAIELPPHGRLVDIDRMISESRRKNLPFKIESTDDLADFLETYADLDKTDHTVVLEAST